MKRIHKKHFQYEQYKVADGRIKRCVIRAKHTLDVTYTDKWIIRQFKRYQII